MKQEARIEAGIYNLVIIMDPGLRRGDEKRIVRDAL